MNDSLRIISISVAMLGAVGGVMAAEPATEPTTAELMEQIKQLQSKVQDLEKKQDEQQKATTQRADVDRVVDELMADAQKRSQWLQTDSLLAGYEGNRFFLKSADGNFALKPWFQWQLRNVTNVRQDVDGGDDVQNGFEIRRMKFGFDGNMFTPKLTYQFQWATNRKSGVPELENAYVKYALSDDWAVMGGQFQDPFAHESLVSSKYGLAADRSLGTQLFTAGENYVQGVSAIYNREAWRVSTAFHDGARNNFNQNFQDFPTNNADFGGAARVEYKAFGDWKEYNEFAPYKLSGDLLVFGAAADYTEAGDTGFLLHTIDAQYNLTSGWSFYLAYIGRSVSNGPVSTGATPASAFDGYDWTAEAMVGYKINRNWEPFLRYSYLWVDAGALAPGTQNDVHEITAGVNYYWYGQAAKFTLDFVYLPNGSPVNEDGIGILANDGSNEFVVRAQFQLLL